MKILRYFRIVPFIVIACLPFSGIFGQVYPVIFDSVFVRRGYILVAGDSVIRFPSDTTILIPDSIRYKVKKDKEYRSQTFYGNFQDKSEQNILLKGLYSTMIREQRDTSSSSPDLNAENYHPELDNKTVGRITVINVDLVEGDVNNPLQSANSGYAKTLNRFHRDTRKSIILKNLTIRQGDRLGAYTLADNEYHLRSLKYIEDARIYTIPDSLNPDIVNLLIVVKDLFPFTVGFGIGGITDYTLGLNDINIAGTGHEFTNSFRYNAGSDPSFGYRGELSINNLWGSFVDARLLYVNDDVQKLSRITVERKFITPETKYGGGIELFHQKTTADISLSDSETVKVPYTKDYFDQWIGRNLLLDKVSRKSIVLKARFMTTLYTSRPEVETDTNQQFYNVYLLLGSISLLKTNHYKERMLLGYGLVEDIDFGYALELTSGYLFSEFFKSPYLGLSLKTAHKYDLGYVGGGIEYGGQNYQNKMILGLFRAAMTYYSPLLKAKKFDCRFLFRVSYTEGIRRYSHEILNLGKEVRGVSNSGVEGNKRFIARFETVTFLRGNLLGFRFSPNLYYDAAFLANGTSLFSSENYFSVAGIGVRIRNENLAFQTIIIRAGYYTGNPLKDAHFGAGFTTSTPDVIRDYEIVKPDVLRY
jgi:hypothetical protein